ncbi:hypothetical protein CHUAL_012290 [Chamberlinius hualienensis]
MTTLRVATFNYKKILFNENVQHFRGLISSRNVCGASIRTKKSTNSSVVNFQCHRSIISGGGVHTEVFKPKRALVLTKLSRYEFEKKRKPELSEEQLEKVLAARGSDYQSLVYHHNIHKQCQESVVKTLENNGAEIKLVNRLDYSRSLIDWADAIFTTGGDGTFLLASSRIKTGGKPVIGINSDPTRSEGYLCLPKKYSGDFPKAMEKLMNGKFRWRWRKRIRITLTGENVYEDPIELHDQQLMYPEYRFIDCIQEQHPAASTVTFNNGNRKKQTRILPVLALNEVFIGESLSSRVSYYELKINEGKFEKQRSSGVTVCTGTGSSSWSFNINKLTPHCVKHMLRIVKEETNFQINDDDSALVSRVMNKFNDSLLFDPSASKMAYTIRDPVINGLTKITKPRGFAKRMEIKSRCFDACLVIDGGLSFIFNDGALAVLEIHDDDALRTVDIDD